MLEDAPLPVSAFGRMLKEILTDRCQVLPAQSLLLLKFFLTVGEAAALVLEAILTGLSVEPEPAQLSFYLFLPAILGFNHFDWGSLSLTCRGRVRRLALDLADWRAD